MDAMCEEKIRLEYLDTISGIFILFMVIHHWQGEFEILRPVYEILLPILYFFMSWFFYKSGRVFNLNRGFHVIVLNSTKRLLLPFVFYSFIGYLIWGISLLIAGELHKNFFYSWISELFWTGSLLGNGPLWYLLSLFVIRILYSSINKKKSLVYVFVGISAIISFIMYGVRLNIPYWCYNVPLGSVFFGLGILRSNVVIDKKNELKIAILTISIFIASMFFCPSIVSVFGNSLCKGNYYIWFISSISGIFIFEFFCKRFITSSFFSWIGRNSMTILVCHMPVLYVFSFVKIFIATLIG